jgi:hypothetical protein
MSTTSNPLSQVLAFARRFGEAHVELAMHAAVPLGLTPDLVHLLRVNFVRHADWIAEADLLLSSLCRLVGGELYEMEPSARRLLLEELKQDTELAYDRVREVAEFLEIYAAYARAESREMRDFLEALRWGALAEINPGATARELAEALRDGLREDNVAEALRIADITDVLSAPLLSEDNLLSYTAELRETMVGGKPVVTVSSSGSSVHGVLLPPIPVSEPVDQPYDEHLRKDLTYASGFDYDLFFSYASVDDEPRISDRDDTRWVTYFRKCLVMAVDRKVGAGDSVRVFWNGEKVASSNAPLTPELKNALERTAIFVAIVSGSYFHPESWCNLERRHFLASLGSTARERAAQRRIWIIQIDEMPIAQLQEAFFPDVKAHVFYEKDWDDRVGLPIPGSDAKADQRFLVHIEDVAEAIVARLREMRPGKGRMRPGKGRMRGVFLAECTADLDSARLKLKLFLAEKGWLILPESDYDDTNYDALLERDLKASLAFVQLIGPYPWHRGHFDVLQNERAKALGIPRFRWRSVDIEEINIVNEPHRAFIFATDVIASGFEDFKFLLDAELRELPRASPAHVRPLRTTHPVVLVAVRAQSADALWAQAYAWLQPASVLAHLLAPEESFEEKYRSEPCHGFLILCDAAAIFEDPFLLSNLIDQCRIIQMREKDGARRPPVGVVYWPPPPPVWSRLLRSVALKTYCIAADAPGELVNFLAEVRRVAS